MHQEDVLDQCTKGAWLSSSDLASTSDIHDATRNRSRFHAQSPALVVDLEGADGIERGTDKSLERRLALFAMVVTEMLIVNTLASTVGLADGGCVPLLTMVFQVMSHCKPEDCLGRKKAGSHAQTYNCMRCCRYWYYQGHLLVY